MFAVLAIQTWRLDVVFTAGKRETRAGEQRADAILLLQKQVLALRHAMPCSAGFAPMTTSASPRSPGR